MSHVVLFGASGFLGAHVVTAMADAAGVSRLTCLGRDRCDLLTTDVDDLRSLLTALKPSAVVNCTGGLDGSATELLHANTLATAKLLDALAGTGVRYVRIGSAGEYGPIQPGLAALETDPANPVREYGLSHLAATRLVELAAQAGRVNGITLRVFNPIGSGMKEGSVLGQAAQRLRAALASGARTITMGPLSAYRDFVDARDVASAVVAAVLTPDPVHRLFNVGSGRAVPVRSAVGRLAQAAGFSGEIREEGEGSARSATVDWALAECTRAATALGWRPRYDVADSVKAIWAGAA
jgi:nucleoside-diphosphate-sugar epimerase